jgi:hypothetical protein
MEEREAHALLIPSALVSAVSNGILLFPLLWKCQNERRSKDYGSKADQEVYTEAREKSCRETDDVNRAST